MDRYGGNETAKQAGWADIAPADLEALALVADDIGHVIPTPAPEHPFLRYALPTRTRPGTLTDPETARTSFVTIVTELADSARTAEQFHNAFDAASSVKPGTVAEVKAWLSAPLNDIDLPAFTRWTKAILLLSNAYYRDDWGTRKPRQRSATEALTCLAEILVRRHGALDAAMAAHQLRSKRSGPGFSQYQQLAWAHPAAVALRRAIVKADDASYEAAIAWAISMLEVETDLEMKAQMSFVLGDDRPGEHPLKPLQVLVTVAAAGKDVGAILDLLPLVAESRPSAVRQWYSRREYFLYMLYTQVTMAEAIGTTLSTAAAYAEPATPALDWLLHYANDEERVDVSEAILATEESGAINLLIPRLHDKSVRAALDKVTHTHPARTFRQLTQALAAGRNEPAFKSRFAAFVALQPAGTLRAWVKGDPKATAYLEESLAKVSAPMAQEAHWPGALRETPWRDKRNHMAPIIIPLTPLPTPFAFRDEDLPPAVANRIPYGRIFDQTGDIGQFVAYIETAILAEYHQPPVARDTPHAGTPEDIALAWTVARLRSFLVVSRHLIPMEWRKVLDVLDHQPEALSLAAWNGAADVTRQDYCRDIAIGMLSRFGDRAVPGLLLATSADTASMTEVLLRVDDARIAPVVATASHTTKKARAAGLSWLFRFPVTASLRLLPDALGALGPARDAAEFALRWIQDNVPNGRDIIVAAAVRYEDVRPGVIYAAEQIMDHDPLLAFPKKIPKLPDWLIPSAYSRPELIDGKGVLPDGAIIALTEMLSFSQLGSVYAGIQQTRSVLTAESAAAFAWDLFTAWLAEGAPPKESWAMYALGWLGNDETARMLTKLIRRWPGEAAHARAVSGLDVLLDLGSDLALMHLNGIAEKLKFKGLQEKARDRIATLAERRGMSADELSDRLVPDFDLDANGGTDIDFGTRKFRGTFDGNGKPLVFDADGKIIKDLPQPGQSDNTEIAPAEAKRWSALKRDAKSAFALQSSRLQTMLSTGRRVSLPVFTPFFARHPLVQHIAARLLWGAYKDDKTGNAPDQVFRLGGILDPEDLHGTPVNIPDNALIGVVHPTHLSAADLVAWKAVFAEDGAVQPFPQLDRATFTFPHRDLSSRESRVLDGKIVASGHIRGVDALGWRLGPPMDAGIIYWLERHVVFPDGAREMVTISFSDGLSASGGAWDGKTQSLDILSLGNFSARGTGTGKTFGDLDPVTASELLYGLSTLPVVDIT